MSQAYFLKTDPAPQSCAVFSSPHSGACYPPDFLKRACLPPLLLRSSEDAFIDRFFDETLGAPVLCARYPRAYVDLNRAADELDPAVVAGAAGRPTNPRIAAGLGVIPRVVANGRAIRLGKMPMQEAKARLDRCYTPYHEALQALINSQHTRFGACILFDLHSMPHRALQGGFLPKRRPDVILGDRYGTACDHWISDRVAEVFTEAGFEVARNAPFAGGHITRHYGQPRNGVHAIQIEIDRSLYMDEKRITPRPDFEGFRARIGAVILKLAAIRPVAQSLAAE